MFSSAFICCNDGIEGLWTIKFQPGRFNQLINWYLAFTTEEECDLTKNSCDSFLSAQI